MSTQWTVQSGETTDRKASLYLAEKRTLFLGCIGQNLSSANAAPMLLVSLGDELELVQVSQGLVFRGYSFLVPAGVQIKGLTAQIDLGLVYLDPVGDDLDQLAQRTRDKLVVNDQFVMYRGLGNESELVGCMRQALDGKVPVTRVFEALDTLMGVVAGEETLPPRDERVIRAARLIKERYAENLSVETIAEEVGLSVPRLIQLFKRKTGVPIRRFRLWQRIYFTILKVSQGMSLTEAAVAAGFADYAHFSRNFKEMSGINPSDVLSAKGGIRLFLNRDGAQVFRKSDLLPDNGLK